MPFLYQHQQEGLNWLATMLRRRLTAAAQAYGAWVRAGEPAPPHQTLWALRDARAASGYLLAWEMGLGKTRIGLALLSAYPYWLEKWRDELGGYMRLLQPKPNLVLVPGWVRISWETELEKWQREKAENPNAIPRPPSGVIFADTNPQHFLPALRRAVLLNGTLICTYDALRARIKDTPLLYETRWGIIIADEVQSVQNPNAQRTRAFWQLDADVRVGLSGTPYTNKIPQLYWVLCGLQGYSAVHGRRIYRWSTIWGKYADYLDKYCDLDMWGAFRGGRNLTHATSDLPACHFDPPGQHVCMALHERMNREVAHRKRKIDCLDLPRLLPPQDIHTPLTATQKRVYKEVCDGIIKWLAEQWGERLVVRNILVRLTYAFEVCTDLRQLEISIRRGLFDEKGPLKDIHLELDGVEKSELSAKLTALLEMLENGLLDSDKALLFTEFATTARLLHADKDLAPYHPTIITGGMKRSEVEAAIKQLNEDDTCRMLISTRAGFQGINLQAASIVILYGKVDWTPGNVAQAIQRAHRIGQTRPVSILRMIAPGTVEEWLYRLLAWKQDMFSLAVDGKLTEERELFQLKTPADVERALKGG